jgi:hypothetical protein
VKSNVKHPMLVWSGLRHKLLSIGLLTSKDELGREYFCDLDGYWTCEQKLTHLDDDESEEVGDEDYSRSCIFCQFPGASRIPRKG